MISASSTVSINEIEFTVNIWDIVKSERDN